jgi:hypothetical protein
MRKGLLIHEEMRKYFPIYSMRRPLVIYDFATTPFWIYLYIWGKHLFSFLSVHFTQTSKCVINIYMSHNKLFVGSTGWVDVILFDIFTLFWWSIRSSEAAMGGGARSASFGVLMSPKRLARSTQAHARPKHTSYNNNSLSSLARHIHTNVNREVEVSIKD